MKYEVWSMVEGALENSDFYDEEGLADDAVVALADEYRRDIPDAEWAVYVLPHSCDTEDCDCVGYLTDHHPVVSSAGDERERLRTA